MMKAEIVINSAVRAIFVNDHTSPLLLATNLRCIYTVFHCSSFANTTIPSNRQNANSFISFSSSFVGCSFQWLYKSRHGLFGSEDDADNIDAAIDVDIGHEI